MSIILPWNIPFVLPKKTTEQLLSAIEIAAASAVISHLMNQSYGSESISLDDEKEIIITTNPHGEE